MKCTPIPGGFACGPKPRRRNCSTPGCNRDARLECDHPVQRKARKPKVGDARLHKEHKVLFYVRAVLSEELLQVSTSPAGGVLQTVSLGDWNTKAEATCDRALCDRCVVVVDGLDWCPAHARAAAL